jgi:hypothetical protein
VGEEGLGSHIPITVDLLRDVWWQFAVQRPDGRRWPGGLSVLEDIEELLAWYDGEVGR